MRDRKFLSFDSRLTRVRVRTLVAEIQRCERERTPVDKLREELISRTTHMVPAGARTAEQSELFASRFGLTAAELTAARGVAF